jgi:hypothetical protein
MRTIRRFVWVAALLVFVAAPALAQGEVKVDPVAAPVAADVPKPLLNVLEAQGARVSKDSATVCEIWLRKDLTLGPPAGGLGDILYGQLGAGNLIGLLHFPAQGADFRGQPLKPGFYAMRYALIPQDGAHMGVFQTRDSILLTPAAADTALDRTLSFADMVKLAKEASGTPHPAFLVMTSAESATAFPSAGIDDHGNISLRLKVAGKNGELPVGITVIGQWVSE